MHVLIEIVGYIGAALLVLAFFLNTSARLESSASMYHFLNIAGSLLVLINSLYHWAIPSVLMSVFWVLIGTMSLLKKKKRQ